MFELPEALLLARIQFAFTVSFHFLFPAITIGLASYLAVLEGLWLKTGRDDYMDLFRYWVKIFAMFFAMGVVSGIVMSYQFGTNWSVFSDRAGPIIGPLMAYEVLTAFFLEAGFLGVMLFGMNRVGRRLHFTATLMVALGTFLSAFWILSVNSWMHTPTGFEMNADGQFVSAGSWLNIIFNPSFPYRLAHTLSAAYLTTAFLVGGVGAWHLLKDRDNPRARIMFSMAMWMAAIVAPVQIVLGDLHGLNTLEHQPVKVMAMEGHYQSYPEGAPLILFGIPNSAENRVDYAVQIPKLSSLILKHDLNAPLAGLDTVPEADRPPVGIVFWAFRIMVGLGFLMAGLGALSLLARFRGKLYDWRWLHKLAIAMAPSGLIAVLAGWITTEVGRQPWTIHGLMRTAEAASPLAAPAVAASLLAFVLVYFAVFGAGVLYILKLMAKPPVVHESPPPNIPVRTAGTTPAVALRPGQLAADEGGTMNFDLTLVWALIIMVAVFVYIVLDRFDLGIGILFRTFKVGPDRDTAMNSIAPVWDGNETWLVLGGSGLLAAFPLAYAVIFSALYAPIIAMLLALVFRGVAFEFRWRDPAHRGFWDLAFTGGSLLAAFSQGVILGALLQGISVSGRAYAGGWWDWLTPFSLITGVSVAIAYALLGATWLIMKAEGELQRQAREMAWWLGCATLAAIVAVSIATLFLSEDYFGNWLNWPNILWVAPVPILVALASVGFARSLKAGHEVAPFLLTLGIFLLSFVGLAISVYPYVIPGAVTIWAAATDRSSQVFMLWGTVLVLPMILGYTAWSYWVFRGKVRADGYHA